MSVEVGGISGIRPVVLFIAWRADVWGVEVGKPVLGSVTAPKALITTVTSLGFLREGRSWMFGSRQWKCGVWGHV